MEIWPHILRLLEKSGESAYPSECCGFVLGRRETSGTVRGLSVVAVDNAQAPDKRRCRFLMEAEDFLRAEQAAAAQGLELTAVFHSHPDHPAEPSEEDLAHALPFYHYLITAVAQGQAQETTCWRLASDRSGFVREPLTIVDKAPGNGEKSPAARPPRSAPAGHGKPEAS
ncbi:MAG: M67 family metallopeptidase [Deltaproteobacteria bacterium]|jgi:proteasome lid subunit RPN8/RPN11|nr:M67 family metallopeptidase [Deltaproteobacteria bacterium]